MNSRYIAVVRFPHKKKISVHKAKQSLVTVNKRSFVDK
jgi:hypothetical protein